MENGVDSGQWHDNIILNHTLLKVYKLYKNFCCYNLIATVYVTFTQINNLSKKEAREILKSNPRYNPDALVPPPESVQYVSFVKRTVSEPVCDAVSDEVGEALPVLPLCSLEND